MGDYCIIMLLFLIEERERGGGFFNDDDDDDDDKSSMDMYIHLFDTYAVYFLNLYSREHSWV